jgi:uncharacterized repeat protein (TIGR03803 family)
MLGRTVVRGSMVATLRLSWVVLILLGVAATDIHAQSIRVLASLNSVSGTNSCGSLVLSGDTLYGTAFRGGAYNYGTVFSVPLSGGSLTTLTSFNGTNGGNPFAGLTLIGSTLYGTTTDQYTGGYGKVFSIPLSGGNPTVLTSFGGGTGSGESPHSNLTLIGNTLYGTTFGGGAYRGGTVFSVPLSGGSLTTLTSFSYSSTGSGVSPFAGLILNGNTLYGTTRDGGANNRGTVFSVPLSGGNPTVLTSFDGSNGSGAVGGLTLIGGTLYGTTGGGGAYSDGTIFSVPLSGGNPTVLTSFNGTNGQGPAYGSLTLSNDGSTFYGVTKEGGAYGCGTIFSIPVSGGDPTVLASFNGVNGSEPIGGLTLIGNTLYGTTGYGGNGFTGYRYSGCGTVFDLTLPVPEPSTFVLLGIGIIGLLTHAWRRRCR